MAAMWTLRDRPPAGCRRGKWVVARGLDGERSCGIVGRGAKATPWPLLLGRRRTESSRGGSTWNTGFGQRGWAARKEWPPVIHRGRPVSGGEGDETSPRVLTVYEDTSYSVVHHRVNAAWSTTAIKSGSGIERDVSPGRITVGWGTVGSVSEPVVCGLGSAVPAALRRSVATWVVLSRRLAANSGVSAMGGWDDTTWVRRR